MFQAVCKTHTHFSGWCWLFSVTQVFAVIAQMFRITPHIISD